jgi:ATP-dependent helicase/DNAse subunit B
VEDKLSRSGLLLNDPQILMAMNSEYDSRFLAGIKVNKGGCLEGKALTDIDSFSDIFNKLSDTVKKIAGDLHSGKADATPLLYKSQSPCDHCRSKPICRKINK